MSKTQTEVRLNRVRLSFPHLFVPSAMNEGDKKKFSAQLILGKDHPDLPKLKAAMKAAAVAKWGDKGIATLTQLVTQERVCLREGDKKMKDGEVINGYAGNMFVSTSSDARPLVIDQSRAPLDATSGKPYGGCYVNAMVAIWAQDNKFGKRVNAQLQGVQFAADGDSFGAGGVANPDAFDVLEDEWNTESGDDAGGLV